MNEYKEYKKAKRYYRKIVRRAMFTRWERIKLFFTGELR